ncbi:MAG TPA: BtpA/SgcQ family protein [Acidimicrobiia bacterium]|nr:BtpA/SgcQ family protein [Acidimicrobiia bacterium]
MTSPRPIPPLVGMVHLAPLPGSPRYGGSMAAVVDDSVQRASILSQAGFQALMVENFGDVPFFAEEVPPVTVAAMTACIAAIRSEVDCVLGVNVLRNAALAAVGIAGAIKAELIRVNVLSGRMTTDQGPITGRAAEVLRAASALGSPMAVWADVFVKHATPPPGLTIEQAAVDTWERGGADALIISGSGTGHAPDLDRFDAVRRAVPAAPLVVGSGATPENLKELAGLVDHVIVGTALEEEGRPGAPIDRVRLDRFMTAASGAGWV